MALKAYNGWPGVVRTARGNQQYNQIRSGNYPMPITGKCELCGNTKGLTHHTEEYGSTYEDFISTSHELCPTCHGMIHMRWKLKNRWFRHKDRLRKGEPILSFPNIGRFFQVVNTLKDIEPYPDVEIGVPWMDEIKIAKYDGPWKVALIIDKEGTFRPDPRVYNNVSSLHGMRWDRHTGLLTPFAYGPPPPKQDQDDDIPF